MTFLLLDGSLPHVREKGLMVQRTLVTFPRSIKPQGQSRIDSTFECKAPGTFNCCMLSSSRREIGNEPVKKSRLN
jgi:hypothetical protein